MEYLVDLPTALYEKAGESEESPLNHLILRVLGGFHMKSLGFHEIRQISIDFRNLADFERPLARNGNSMFLILAAFSVTL